MYYPLFLDITQSHCLIVGAGEVGIRKAMGLLAASAKEVLVLDIAPFSPQWQELATHTALRLEQRPFTEQDLQQKTLVFACTGHKELNARIAQSCLERHILCNCVDAPRKGNCIVPAVAQAYALGVNASSASPKDGEPSLMAALSTQGASPAWARILRKELEQWLIPHAPMTKFLGKLRPLVLALGEDTRHNTALFRALVDSPLRHHLAENNTAACEALLQELLPVSLHSYIAELLYDTI